MFLEFTYIMKGLVVLDVIRGYMQLFQYLLSVIFFLK